MNASSHRIERSMLLKAPLARVWHALSEAKSFGSWFGVALEGQRFVPGTHVQGHITYPGYEHLVWNVLIERMEPERLFSFRWHPYAVDPNRDYSKETTTLVAFTLEQSGVDTLLHVEESGFDAIPAERRAEAFRMNSEGWDQQMRQIAAHLRQQ